MSKRNLSQITQAFDAMTTEPTRYDINFKGMSDNNNVITLVIDSKDRNTTKYPNPNKYSIMLDPFYKEVTSIELVSANIHKSFYNINQYNNVLSFIENTKLLTVIVPPGTYTVTLLISTIQTLLQAASQAHELYSVSLNLVTNIITITQPVSTSTVFSLYFLGDSERASNDYTIDEFGNKTYNGDYIYKYATNSIGRILGFKPQVYVGTTVIGTKTTRVISADFPVNLNFSPYIALFLNKNKKFNHVDSCNNNIRDCFCIVPIGTDGFTYNKDMTQARYIKYLNEPLQTLDKLDIEFVDNNGNLYEFNNQEHTLIFEIKSQTRQAGFR